MGRKAQSATLISTTPLPPIWIFNFPLKKAIYSVKPDTGETYLVPYYYYPKFITLNENELDNYITETKKLFRLYSNNHDDEKNDIIKKIVMKRANIIKNAINKYDMLETLLDQLNNDIKHCIIYCTPQQINRIRLILRNRGLLYHKFTMEEGVIPKKKFGRISERDYILQKFSNGDYKVLVAMKCLDEGVDVPPARLAILMASSGNPREYIQRLGRILRNCPGKDNAIIFDIIVQPQLSALPKELKEIEKKIFKREIKRYLEISRASVNITESYNTLVDVQHKVND